MTNYSNPRAAQRGVQPVIVLISPVTDWRGLDLIVEEQAAYYGAHNAHVIAWLWSKRGA